MRHLSLLLALTLALAPLATAAFAADPECHTLRKGQRWQTGKVVKVQITERSEGGPGAFFPPQPEGAPPAATPPTYGQVLDLTVTSAGQTYMARCPVGTAGCDADRLSTQTSIRFFVDRETLVLKRADGHLLCARVAKR